MPRPQPPPRTRPPPSQTFIRPRPPPPTTTTPRTTPRLKALILTIGVASITATGAWYGASLKISQDARKEKEDAEKVFGKTLATEMEKGEELKRERIEKEERKRESEEEEMVRKLEEARVRLVRAREEVRGKLRGLEERSGVGPEG